MKYFLPLILTLFVICSNLDINSIINFRANGELSFLELFQALILFLCICIHLLSRKEFLDKSNKITFFARLFIFIFLLYEEISFVTHDSQSKLLNSLSTQSEINIHNSNFLFNDIFSFSLPFLNETAYLNGYVLSITISLFIIGFGSYFSFLKKFRYFFLDQRLSLYSLIFLVNIPLNGILNITNYSLIFLKGEFCELF